MQETCGNRVQRGSVCAKKSRDKKDFAINHLSLNLYKTRSTNTHQRLAY